MKTGRMAPVKGQLRNGALTPSSRECVCVHMQKCARTTTAHTFLNNSSPGPIRSKKVHQRVRDGRSNRVGGNKKNRTRDRPSKKIAYIGFG